MQTIPKKYVFENKDSFITYVYQHLKHKSDIHDALYLLWFYYPNFKQYQTKQSNYPKYLFELNAIPTKTGPIINKINNQFNDFEKPKALKISPAIEIPINEYIRKIIKQINQVQSYATKSLILIQPAYQKALDENNLIDDETMIESALAYSKTINA